MSVKGITSQNWIIALFVRDDNEKFVLGSGGYEFKDDMLHFTANTMVNDTVEIQGNDGILLAGQVKRAQAQEFNGYIGDFGTNKSKTEQLRQDFLKFFAKNHFYKVIYIFTDGSAIQRKRGFIVDAPECREIEQMSPEFHVSLNFEDVNYYDYAENADGDEIYSGEATATLANAQNGGLIWDSIGIVFDSIGATWEAGTGGICHIQNSSIDSIYPVITITSVTKNPVFVNSSTNTTLSYTGNIAAGQTLVIDCNRQTAKLNGTNVVSNLSGDWIRLGIGDNIISYTADNTDAPSAKVSWNEIVG